MATPSSRIKSLGGNLDSELDHTRSEQWVNIAMKIISPYHEDQWTVAVGKNLWWICLEAQKSLPCSRKPMNPWFKCGIWLMYILYVHIIYVIIYIIILYDWWFLFSFFRSSCRTVRKTTNVLLPSGYLTVRHGKWPIYRWFTWVYLLKLVIFHGTALSGMLWVDFLLDGSSSWIPGRQYSYYKI